MARLFVQQWAGGQRGSSDVHMNVGTRPSPVLLFLSFLFVVFRFQTWVLFPRELSSFAVGFLLKLSNPCLKKNANQRDTGEELLSGLDWI